MGDRSSKKCCEDEDLGGPTAHSQGSEERTQGQWGGHGVSGEDTVREGHGSSGAMAWVDAYRRYEVMCTA